MPTPQDCPAAMMAAVFLYSEKKSAVTTLKNRTGIILIVATILMAGGGLVGWVAALSSKKVSRLSLTKTTYITQVGEQRELILPDESLVNLDTDTQLEVAYSQNARSLRLGRGQAFFEVVGDERNLPFRIEGGAGRITAWNDSAFQVYVDDHVMIVTVESGTVVVGLQTEESKEAEITDLQQVTVSTANEISEIQRIEKINDDWRDGWLEAESTPLPDILAELDRYYRGNIRLDEDFSQLHISGRFKVDEAPKGLRLIVKSMQLDFGRCDGDFIIFRRLEDSEKKKKWKKLCRRS